MIHHRTEEEIEILRENALLVSKTLAEVAKNIQPGVQLIKLDKIAETFIKDHGAEPGFKGYKGFPNTLCLSVNDVVVHGIPTNDEVVREGDILSVDCGTYFKGYYGDTAFTFPVGEVKEEVRKLLERTRESLFRAIDVAVIGKRVGDIGHAVQNFVEGFGYTVVRDLVGHGIGKKMHESPEVPNYGRRGHGSKLENGMVLCIEPMINLGKRNVVQDNDGWTIRTADGKPSAHYELTVAINKHKADVLSTFDFIDEILNNKN